MKRVLAVTICCLAAAVIFSQTRAQSPKATGTESTAQAEQPKRTPDVIFVPTPQEAVDKMLELAEVKNRGVRGIFTERNFRSGEAQEEEAKDDSYPHMLAH